MKNTPHSTAMEVTGLTQSQLSRHAAAGKIVRITRGLYVREEPSPYQLARLVQRRWPQAVLTGESALQLFLGEELTFPLRLVAANPLPTSQYFSSVRSRSSQHWELDGLRCHYAILAVAYLDDAQAIDLLERNYRGPEGHKKLEQDMAGVSRLPKRTHELAERASVGSDSPKERELVKALRGRGVKVLTNHKIGPYRYDAVLPELGVAVEVHGFEYHNSRESLIKDSWKANCAALHGYTMLQYTGSCIKYHLPVVLEQILGAKEPDLEATGLQALWLWHRFVVPWGPREWAA